MAGRGEVLQAAISIAGVIDPSLGKATSSAIGSLEKINLKSLATKAAIAGGAIAITKAAIEAGKQLYNLGTEFDENYKKIRVATGATGEALNGLKDDFRTVMKQVPNSMDEVSTAIGDYNTRLGLSGTSLQNISVQALNVSQMLGEDLSTVIENSSQAFKNWNLSSEQMGSAMDYIFKVSQSTGVGFSELMSRMQSSGAVLQNVGFSFEQSAALIGQVDKAGLNTAEVLKGLKKGLGNVAKKGQDANKVFLKYFDTIKNTKDENEALTKATEIFGSATAVTMTKAIRSGIIDVSEFQKQLSESSETINGAAQETYTLSQKMDILKNNVQTALEPLATKLVDIANKCFPYVLQTFEMIAPVIESVAGKIAPYFDKAFAMIQPILEKIPSVVQTIISNSQVAISAVMPFVQSVWSSLQPMIALFISTIQSILPVIISIGSTFINEVIPPISSFIALVLDLGSKLVSVLMPVIQVVASVITGALGGALSSAGNILNSFLTVIGNVVSFITNVFTGQWAAAWQNVKNIFTSVASGLASAFKAPINFIIGGINGFIRGINRIKIPDWVPGVGGKGFNISTIPMLATGGIADGMAIAGEAGKEAVISLGTKDKKDALKTWVDAGKQLGQLNNDPQHPLDYAKNGTSGFVNNPTFVGRDERDIVISFQERYRNQNIDLWQYAGRQLGALNQNSIKSMNALQGLPRFAQGGHTNGVSIAGEAGRETVISYDPAYRDKNIGYWMNAGKQLGLLKDGSNDIPDLNSYVNETTDNSTTTYDFSGLVYAPNITYTSDKVTEEDKEKLKEVLKSDKEEFYDFIQELLEEREIDKF